MGSSREGSGGMQRRAGWHALAAAVRRQPPYAASPEACCPRHSPQGLPGAESCNQYTFVDERPGGWVAVARALNQQLAARGKKQVGRGVLLLVGVLQGTLASKRLAYMSHCLPSGSLRSCRWTCGA